MRVYASVYHSTAAGLPAYALGAWGTSGRTEPWSYKTGAGLGSYGISDMALSGGWGRQVLREGLGAGFALKYIRETIETVSADGLAFDGGLLYDAPEVPGLRLAAVLRNFGPPIRYQREAQNLPLELRTGAAYTFYPREMETTLALDVAKPRGNEPELAVGLESVLMGRLPLRVGYDMRNNAGLGLTAGFGWRARDFRVDYAFVSFGELGSAHRISAAWRWGPGEEGAPRPTPVIKATVRPAPPPPPPAPAAAIPPSRHYLLPRVQEAPAPPKPIKPAPPAKVEPPPAPKPAPKPEAAPPTDEF